MPPQIGQTDSIGNLIYDTATDLPTQHVGIPRLQEAYGQGKVVLTTQTM